MASRNLFQPGRRPRDLNSLMKLIIRKLNKSPLGFKKLWDDEEIHDEARSELMLSRALKELESDGLIKKGYVSRKNQPYFLTDDAKAIQKTMELSQYLEDVRGLSDSIEKIKIEDSDITEGNQQAVESLFWNTQLVLLKIIQILTHLDSKTEPITRRWFREQFLDTLFELAVFCSKVLPDTTEAAIVKTAKEISRVRPEKGVIENEYLSGISKITEELIIKLLEI